MPRRWARRLGWLSLGVLMFGWVTIAVLGDRVWWALPFLYGPRWLLAAPFLGMLPWFVSAPRRAALPVVAALLIAVFGIFDVRLGIGGHFAGTGPTLRVLELNAGGGNGGSPDGNRIIAEFREKDPDIIVIAECNVALLDTLKVAMSYHAERSLTNLCLLSKGDILNWSVRDPMDFWKYAGSGAIVRAVVATPHGPVRLGLVQLATPRNALDNYQDLSTIPTLGPITRANIHQREIESAAAREWILMGDPLPTIIAGDFNLPIESAIYRKYWSGFRNAFSHAGVGTGYTKHTRWWGARIDHILMSGEFDVRRSFVGHDVGSDHLPVIADLVFSAPASRGSP